MNEDWDVLVSFLPGNWRQLAQTNGALKGLRKDKSAETLLRILLLHLGYGYSLRETALRASKANLATLSDVALLKRLRKSKDWLHALCVALFEEQGVNVFAGRRAAGQGIRCHDGQGTRQNRGALANPLQRAPSLPDLRLLQAHGDQGAGRRRVVGAIPHCSGRLRAGRPWLLDRPRHSPRGVFGRSGHRAPQHRRLAASTPQRPAVRLVDSARLAQAWWHATVLACRGGRGGRGGAGTPVCDQEDARGDQDRHARLRKEAARKGKQVQARTLVFANYVMVFTTWPEATFTAPEVLEWYRIRWQVELVFKRFKSLAQLGHVPKHDPESAKAWLYGKLLVALLTEKLIYHAATVSPWDTTWRRYRPRSAWREFKFMLNQVTRAIEPCLPLAQVLVEWNDLSRALADRPRRRLSQLAGALHMTLKQVSAYGVGTAPQACSRRGQRRGSRWLQRGLPPLSRRRSTLRAHHETARRSVPPHPCEGCRDR